MRKKPVAAVSLVVAALLAAPAGADERTITCGSRNYRYQYCRVDTDNRVTLVHQRSSTRCRQFDNWGYDSRSQPAEWWWWSATLLGERVRFGGVE